ncbi:MAG: polysaccharide export protein [Gammaproteobacteria bacterium]|nr:polysaccharide export protein [Gammaproteobacteria bacterium]
MRNLLRSVRLVTTLGALAGVLVMTGCASQKNARPELPTASGDAQYSTRYRIAPGDSVQIFVWRNPEVSTSVPVRPDGLLSAPLLEEVPAAGKTPAELARDLEAELATYLRDPLVTVIVGSFVGTFREQIRVVGESAKPQALLYRDSMTLLDVMVETGGLTQYAAGNDATLIRAVDGNQEQFRLRLDDLLKDGDITANVDMRPGDIIIVPEAWF